MTAHLGWRERQLVHLHHCRVCGAYLCCDSDEILRKNRPRVQISAVLAERIRTYNYPQGRVTDHRIGLTLYKLEQVLNGDLDELFDALNTFDQAENSRRAPVCPAATSKKKRAFCF